MLVIKFNKRGKCKCTSTSQRKEYFNNEDKMRPEFEEKIIQELSKRKATLPCHRCGHTSFQLLNGFFKHTVQDDLKQTILGGPTLPTIGVACSNCGNVSFHALGALGFLENADTGESNE